MTDNEITAGRAALPDAPQESSQEASRAMLATLYTALHWVERQAYGGTAHVEAARALRAAIAAAEGRA